MKKNDLNLNLLNGYFEECCSGKNYALRAPGYPLLSLEYIKKLDLIVDVDGSNDDDEETDHHKYYITLGFKIEDNEVFWHIKACAVVFEEEEKFTILDKTSVKKYIIDPSQSYRHDIDDEKSMQEVITGLVAGFVEEFEKINHC